MQNVPSEKNLEPCPWPEKAKEASGLQKGLRMSRFIPGNEFCFCQAVGFKNKHPTEYELGKNPQIDPFHGRLSQPAFVGIIKTQGLGRIFLLSFGRWMMLWSLAILLLGSTC